MTLSLKANKPVEIDSVGLFADGVAVRKVGEKTFSICKKNVDEMVTVNTDEICAAIKDVFEDTRSILEPAGALSIAGLKKHVVNNQYKNNNLVAIACGANMNFERLRFVAERAELGEEREAMLAVGIPEKAGSLKLLCETIGSRNLTEFSYRMSEGNRAQIFMGVEVSDVNDRELFINQIKKMNFDCHDLSNDELSKVHLRHMVGGRLPRSINEISKGDYKELLYRFEFPERPGALMRFVNSMRPEWTISIFHYRNHGADTGRIVIGVLVKDSDSSNWDEFVKKVSYKYWEETENPAYKLFLGA